MRLSGLGARLRFGVHLAGFWRALVTRSLALIRLREAELSHEGSTGEVVRVDCPVGVTPRVEDANDGLLDRAVNGGVLLPQINDAHHNTKIGVKAAATALDSASVL